MYVCCEYVYMRFLFWFGSFVRSTRLSDQEDWIIFFLDAIKYVIICYIIIILLMINELFHYILCNVLRRFWCTTKYFYLSMDSYSEYLLFFRLFRACAHKPWNRVKCELAQKWLWTRKRERLSERHRSKLNIYHLYRVNRDKWC